MGEKKKFQLDAEAGYFRSGGVDVMAFDDFYPAGHQSGISVLMHGERAATNGDLRFEQTPGQWQPTPKQGERTLDAENNRIVTKLSYPDEDAHLRGFNPIIYPDFAFSYTVTAEGIPGGVAVTVDLDKPVPEEFLGKLCFDLELFPGALFGKPWMMDGQSGIFPRQPNGPTMQQKRNLDHTYPNQNKGMSSKLSVLADDTKGYNPIIADDLIAEPYARGHVFTLRPDDDEHRMTVVCRDAELKLYDGRMNHNNGWFVLSSEVPAGKTEGAVRWEIFPNTVKNWKREPVVQVSQVGYHPAQPKTAFAELDREDDSDGTFTLEKLTPDCFTPVLTGGGKDAVASVIRDGRHIGSLGVLLETELDEKVWKDARDVRRVAFTPDGPVGVVRIVTRGEAKGEPFEMTLACHVAAGRGDFVAEIERIENLGKRPLPLKGLYLRPFAAGKDVKEAPGVPNLWQGAAEGTWELADGTRYGLVSGDADVRFFHLWINPNGGQHPDAAFAPSEPTTLDPGQAYTPPRPLSARVVIGGKF